MSTLGYIYIFLWPGINFKAAFLKLRKRECCAQAETKHETRGAVMQMSKGNVKMAVKN